MMIQSSAARSCLRHFLSSQKIVFRPVIVNSSGPSSLISLISVRSLSVSSIKLSSGDKITSSDIEALLEPKSAQTATESVSSSAASFNSSNSFEPVSANKEVFSEGADSLLSAVPADVSSLAEPTFSSLGLAHGWPSGWLQSVLETLHIDVGLPWWQAIAVTTLCLRIVIFPVMVASQKAIVRNNEHLPTIQKLQIQQQLASVRGNIEESRFASQALNNYMMAENCHPFKTMLPILTQAAFFTSVFFGLRGMCNVPVESLKTGGLFWFTDLTLADPFFALPLITASTIYLQLYLGADGMNTANQPPWMKALLYAMPIISIPVMINFPTALNMYWLTNNLISLVQASVIRQPGVRQKLGIPEMTRWKPEDLPMTTFYEELKREMASQRSKEKKLEATREREKKEYQEEERRKRQELLAAFDEERKQQEKKKQI